MRRFWIISTAILLIAWSATSWADTVKFDFNSLIIDQYHSAKTSVAGNQAYLNNMDPIESYMESLWGSDIQISAGAKTQEARLESGHPSGYFLGNSDGATDNEAPFINLVDPVHPYDTSAYWDTFLINQWQSGYTQFTIYFYEPITSVEFDWEIFPQTTGIADIEVIADGNQIFYWNATSYRTLGDIGHFNTYIFSQPVHQLEFIDWTTAPIGIDNLIVGRNYVVPEPASLLFVGTGLAILGLVRLRRPRK